MIKEGKGGGRTVTGLHFERGRDIISLVAGVPGYSAKANVVFYQDKEIARSFKKNQLYQYLASRAIDYKTLVSKRLLPDEAIYVMRDDRLFIIEMKYQETPGSVDEKLQTCDFKKKQYTKLLKPLGIKVEYIYLLNDWFQKPEYKDTLAYIRSVGCHYFFHELPLSALGLPSGK